MRQYLFRSAEMHNIAVTTEAQMSGEIAAVPEAQLLGTSPEELATYFAEKYALDLPSLREEDISVEDVESRKDVSRDFDRVIHDRSRAFYVPATEFKYYVPFDGDPQFFHCRGSLISHNPPLARVEADQLIFSYLRTDDSATAVRAEFDRDLAHVKQLLADVVAHGERINAGLQAKALAQISARRERRAKSKSTVAALGYPVRRRGDAPRTYAVPDVKRKLVPAMPKVAPGAPLEPSLDQENYEHILTVISGMVRVIERSPAAFVGMKEEDLRQHFLVQLNGQYQGQATGETFNFEGKTDILIRAGGRNIFIAECKFWEGSKALDAAINQLLGYLTWHDTKAALVLFNRARSLTTVLARIPEVLKAREEFVREIPQEGRTRFRYVLHHRDDPEREIVLTVLVFEVPSSGP